MKKALVGYFIHASEPEYEDVLDSEFECSCSEDDHYIFDEQVGCECSCHEGESK
tara:strand:- start:195 stop:356 length:162 start_codon:yes stop_codon:yes gene_type:complete